MDDKPHTVRFLSPDGTQWSVYEITERRGTETARALIFVSDEGFRRVRQYPDGWQRLDPDRLWALSWRR